MALLLLLTLMVVEISTGLIKGNAYTFPKQGNLYTFKKNNMLLNIHGNVSVGNFRLQLQT